MALRKRDPRTKEELLDRMLSFDFDGDIRHLGVSPASIVRTGPNRLELTFPDSGVTFELSVHRPRDTTSPRSFAPFGPRAEAPAPPQEEWTAQQEDREPPRPPRSRQGAQRGRGRNTPRA